MIIKVCIISTKIIVKTAKIFILKVWLNISFERIYFILHVLFIYILLCTYLLVNMNVLFKRTVLRAVVFFLVLYGLFSRIFFIQIKKNNDSVTGNIDILAEKVKNFGH